MKNSYKKDWIRLYKSRIVENKLKNFFHETVYI